MKNFILLFSLIFTGGTAWAQYALPLLQEAEKQSYNNLSLRSASSESTDTIIFEDFANGVPEGWTNDGWEYRGVNTNPSLEEGSIGAYSGVNNNPPTNDPIESITSSNGFMIFDSDFYDNNGIVGAFGTGSNPTPHVGVLISDTLDFTNYPFVQLEFTSYYRRFVSNVQVQLSTDNGNTWSDTLFIHPIDVNESTSIDEKVKLNISNQVGNANNVKIKFEFDGFSYDGENTGYYFWMIDDILIREAAMNDLELYAAVLNMTDGADGFRDFYGQTPLNQVSDIEYGVGVYNFGINQQTNVTSTIDVSGSGLFNDSHVYSNYNLDSDSSYVEYHANLYLPEVTGEYINNFTVTTDSIEDTPDDNTSNVIFNVSDTVFAPYYSFENSGSVGTNFAADGFKAANLLELIVEDELTSATIILSSQTELPGGYIQITIAPSQSTIVNEGTPNEYTSTTPNEGEIFIYSEFYTLTQSDIDEGIITIPIPTNYNGLPQNRNLAPGSYFIIVECYSNANASPIYILDDKTYDYRGVWGSVIFLPGEQWYTNGEALGIGANFGDWTFEGSVSIEENPIASSYNAFPNPTNGITRFAYNLNTSGDLTIIVRNIMGQVVYNSEEGHKTAGAHETTIDFSKLAKGTYTYELTINNASVYGKLIIK